MMEGANGFNNHAYTSSEMPAAATMQATRPINIVESQQPTIERRKFTILELKRLCAFPDDFVLMGSYSQQWERLGNSVPPLMMRAIAEQILMMLNGCKAERRTNGSENTRSKSQADGRAAQAS
jgi:site-specific DNA-cytosine methylase